MGFIAVTLNPLKQLDKAKDSSRLSDIKELQTAADTYYNDNNCYPQSLSDLNGSTVYIKQIPSDPDGGGYLYVKDDTADCPQWNVLLAKLAYKPVNSTSCPLEQLSGCLPTNYNTSGYNFCVISGNVDCTIISAYTIPGVISPVPTSQASPTSRPNSPTPTSRATPTITPAPTLVPGGCYCSLGGLPNGPRYDIRAGTCNLVGNAPYNYCNISCTVRCQ